VPGRPVAGGDRAREVAVAAAQAHPADRDHALAPATPPRKGRALAWCHTPNRRRVSALFQVTSPSGGGRQPRVGGGSFWGRKRARPPSNADGVRFTARLANIGRAWTS
jgi:hypothetical protein